MAWCSMYTSIGKPAFRWNNLRVERSSILFQACEKARWPLCPFSAPYKMAISGGNMQGKSWCFTICPEKHSFINCISYALNDPFINMILYFSFNNLPVRSILVLIASAMAWMIHLSTWPCIFHLTGAEVGHNV